MDSFEWNKIFGAVLGTVLVIVALNIFVGGLMTPHKAEKPGMEVVVADAPSGNGGTPAVEAKPDWGTVLPAADVATGEKVHQRCLTCHDFSKGGPNKIGPNLWGIVGNKHAHEPAFSYSAAVKAMAEKTWGYDELDAFLKNPKAAIPGTKMAFAGLSKVNDRVNLIAYLRSLSDAPMAIPAPAPAAAPPAAPAEGATEPPAGELQATPPGSTPAEAPETPGATPLPASPAGAPTAPPAATPPKPAAGGTH